MAIEVELKLSIDPAALSELKRHPALAALGHGKPRTTTLTTTYFDTPTLELRDAGVALRLRRAAGRWHQSVKGGGGVSAGLHSRGEFEWPLRAPRFDPEKLATTPWRKLFAASLARCRTVFVTTVKRTEQPLVFPDGTRAMLCIDVGEIRAGRRRVSLTEIELELGRGNPARLFELAAVLADDLPIRVDHASKAQRGYALALQASAEPRRARIVDLTPDATLETALAAIGGDCLAQMGVNAEAIQASNDPEFLHQLRIGWRRLRSLLRLASDVAPAATIAALELELEQLGVSLGPARDWDVFATETLPAIAAHFRGHRELSRLRARVTRQRRRLYTEVRGALAAPSFQRLLLALGTLFANLATNPVSAGHTPLPVPDWAAQRLELHDRKLRKRIKRVHHTHAAERHRARVAAKKLRYAAEFFAPLYAGKRAAEYIAALAKLQAALGVLNDLASAERILGAFAPHADAPPARAHVLGIVHGWLGARVTPELQRLRDAQRAFRRCQAFWR